MKLLHAYYDLRAAPLSFDFAWFLACAVARARLRDMKLAIHLFRPQFRRTSALEHGYGEGYLDWRFSNIIVRLCELCPDVVDIQINKTTTIKISDPYYPESYHPLRVDTQSGVTRIPISPGDYERETGGRLDQPVFRCTEYARRWARQFATDAPIIILTVRHTPHNSGRNTPVCVWNDVYDSLCHRGFNVLTIPDQDEILNEMENHGVEWNAVPEAAMDLDLRLAFYESAALTITWSNGTGSGLLPLCDARFIAFGIWNEKNNVSTKSFFERRGIVFGRQPNWLESRRQWFDWTASDDLTADYILSVVDKWLPETVAGHARN